MVAAWYIGGIVGYEMYSGSEFRIKAMAEVRAKPIVPPKMLFLHLKNKGLESGLDERDPLKSPYYNNPIRKVDLSDE